ncbi:STAS domain-containing protein [Streptosporangium sp. NPDC004379]|uniref:STAS domain-containing protein n=1 Tax=Streptosporangium sp. NPDC004379 TaxID=3366189 RepID=UPI0036C47256
MPIINLRVVIMSIWPGARPRGQPPSGGAVLPPHDAREQSFHGLRISVLTAPIRLKVSGEIDRTTREPWADALGGLTLGGDDMHLDLSELTFIDVRGVWLLTEAARSLPSGKKVYLHHSPYCLRSVLTLIGPDPSPIQVETP